MNHYNAKEEIYNTGQCNRYWGLYSKKCLR